MYTGSLAAARPYLHLFEMLSDHFLAYDEDRTSNSSNEELKSLLQRVTSCDPSEIPQYVINGPERKITANHNRLLHRLSTGEAAPDATDETSTQAVRVTIAHIYAVVLTKCLPKPPTNFNVQPWTDSEATSGMDLMLPFELLDECIRPDAFGQDLMGFWTVPSTL